MRGTGVAIERRTVYCMAMSYAVFFRHSPSALGCYHLDRVVIAWGMAIYAAMALLPHFGLFYFPNCHIVYLSLVVYDVHECFYFHIVSV